VHKSITIFFIVRIHLFHSQLNNNIFQFAIFWDIAPSGPYVNRRFGGAYNLQLQIGNSDMQETACSIFIFVGCILLRYLRILYEHIIYCIYYMCDRLCGLVVRVLGYRFGGPGFDSQAIQVFPKKKKKRKTSSGSGTGFTQPREYNWGATW
jgi:hypothetical protein